MAPVIEVHDLRKSYDGTPAVDGVSFAVEAGEFFGILGPNGAGKTTTLELVEGLREPDGGTVTVTGLDPWPRNRALLPRIGVQLQSSAFFDRLTVREQIATFAALYGVEDGRIDAALETVGLADRHETPTNDLSGGQKQRLSIACALVHDPEVVFLDEPTAALDPQARRNLWDMLRSITGAGRTVVLTTHHMDEAEILCDRVAIMDHGRILRLDEPAALIRDLGAPLRISVAASALDLAHARAIEGVEDAEVGGSTLTLRTRNAPVVLGALAQHGALEGLQVAGATLEDVFLDLTGREYRV